MPIRTITHITGLNCPVATISAIWPSGSSQKASTSNQLCQPIRWRSSNQVRANSQNSAGTITDSASNST